MGSAVSPGYRTRGSVLALRGSGASGGCGRPHLALHSWDSVEVCGGARSVRFLRRWTLVPSRSKAALGHLLSAPLPLCLLTVTALPSFLSPRSGFSLVCLLYVSFLSLCLQLCHLLALSLWPVVFPATSCLFPESAGSSRCLSGSWSWLPWALAEVPRTWGGILDGPQWRNRAGSSGSPGNFMGSRVGGRHQCILPGCPLPVDAHHSVCNPLSLPWVSWNLS